MNSVVSIIPARGGSKGIQRKNIKKMDGKPLLAYTIESSLNASLIDRTIVSTEDPEIIEVAKAYNAEVPFIRPKALAEDNTTDFPVIKHALEYLINKEKYFPDILVYLRPTMPTRTSEEVDKVIKLLLKNDDADCVRTTMSAPYPPYWIKKINNNGYLEPYDKHVEPFTMKRRQDLPKVVMCDGYVDAAKVKSILGENTFPPGNKLGLFRSNIPFHDLDTQEDWEYCEYYIKKRKRMK